MIDRILTGGLIHTPSGDACAVALEDGCIRAVGGDEEILRLACERTEITDLKNACVVPGFIDSHCHLAGVGMDERRVKLYGAQSAEEIIERGREYIARVHPEPGSWIVARGFDQRLFPDGRMPDGRTADAISERHPVLIERVCGHIGALNRVAMEKMGYSDATVIPGGALMRGGDGRVNGIVSERALDLVLMSQPAPDPETLTDILLSGIKRMNRFGITSVQSDDLMCGITFDTLQQAVSLLRARGQFTLRLFEECQAPNRAALNAFLSRGLRSGDGDGFFTIGNIKLLADGSLGAHTAYMRKPYADQPDTRGVSVYEQAELDELVRVSHDAGMQIAIHAIGDGALEMCLNAFEAARCGDSSLRHRVVHCQFAMDDQLARMRRLGIAADIQPPFTATDAGMVAPRVGKARAKQSYRWRTMLNMGIPIAGGSDAPVETVDPIWGMACAVTRTDANNRPHGGWMPEERLTAREALSLYTERGAYASFEESKKGAIVPGMFADFAVLNRSPLRVKPEEIKDIRVIETIIGGKTVYRKTELG